MVTVTKGDNRYQQLLLPQIYPFEAGRIPLKTFGIIIGKIQASLNKHRF